MRLCPLQPAHVFVIARHAARHRSCSLVVIGRTKMRPEASLLRQQADRARNERTQRERRRLAAAINYLGLLVSLALGVMVVVAAEARLSGERSLSAIDAGLRLDAIRTR